MLRMGFALCRQDSGYSLATHYRATSRQSRRRGVEGTVHEKQQLSVQLDTILTARSKHEVHKKPCDSFFLPKRLPADS